MVKQTNDLRKRRGQGLRILLAAMVALGAAFFWSCGDDEADPPNMEEAPFEATYMVHFIGTWSASDHPVDYPSNDHFSTVIGMNHNRDTFLYRVGNLASKGIEKMAEIGALTPLDTEIEAIVDRGQAGQLLTGVPLQTGTTRDSFEITVDQDHPLVSLVSMIAPSPDWFVGVDFVNLFVNDQWEEVVELNAGSYDAGTDSGETYASSNADTDPKENVHFIAAPPLGDGSGVSPAAAIFRFERKQ